MRALNFFNMALIFYLCGQKSSASAAGLFCLLSYWLTTIRAFSNCFPTPLRIAQRLSNSLWEFPRGFPIPFQQSPAAVQLLLRAFLSSYQLKRGNFHPFSLKGGVLSTFIKSRRSI
jgi:hypothetical protein